MITIEECFSLKGFNTFGLSVRTRFFAEASTEADLKTIVGVFKENPLPKIILGGGSNILFTQDYEGIVIYPALSGIELVKEDEEYVWVKAYAGENWDAFVNVCVTRNWGGIENLSLIPGNVGACPIQNIGAYGVEVKDTIESVDVLNLETLQYISFSNADCHFGYRDSIFKREMKNKVIITSVTFKLNKKPLIRLKYADVNAALKDYPEVTIAAVRNAIIGIRQEKLPNPEQYGNAGSFFKNPVIPLSAFEKLKETYPLLPSYPADGDYIKIPTAWLIETAGWKDKREGEVGTYPKQPLVIVNYGKATGDEIIAFARKIQQAVSIQFNIDLEMEVNIF